MASQVIVFGRVINVETGEIVSAGRLFLAFFIREKSVL
jgi:hypothetical protein